MMNPLPDLQLDPFEEDRLVIVAQGLHREDVLDDIRRRYPRRRVSTCDTYLGAIADLSRQPARAVIAGVDTTLPHMSGAVAGLREAAGPQTRLLLCCRPETEPATRRLLEDGADGYVVIPIRGEELDRALGLGIAARAPASFADREPFVSMEELDRLGGILSELENGPSGLLDQLANFLMSALPVKGVQITVEDKSVTVGEQVDSPSWSSPLSIDEEVVGLVRLGRPTKGGFTPAEGKKLNRCIALVNRILEAAARQQAWRHRALTDELSGLPNRRYLLWKLDRILNQASVRQLPVTVLIFDVDNFKSYNDTFGHAAGDQVLCLTGQVFREHSRQQDIVTRYGGDEFAVVFWDPEGPRVPGSKHPEAALEVLERVSQALKDQTIPAVGAAAKSRVTISGGLATYPWDGTCKEDLLSRADEALRAAKKAGKNRVFLIGEQGGDPNRHVNPETNG